MFLFALVSAAGIVWLVADRIVARAPDRRQARQRLFAPAAVVIAGVAVLYLLRLIPPVPLSVQFQGIYHQVERTADGYALSYVPGSRWTFWRRDSRPFRRREGDRLYYFARIFAPSRFQHRVVIHWEVEDPISGDWTTSDRIPLLIVGGRNEGFRGYAVKSNFRQGHWRVTAETEDGRAIATMAFDVRDDQPDVQELPAERPVRTVKG